MLSLQAAVKTAGRTAVGYVVVVAVWKKLAKRLDDPLRELV